MHANIQKQQRTKHNKTASQWRQTTHVYLVTLVWPSPWPHDLDTRPWPRYSKDVPAHQKWSL